MIPAFFSFCAAGFLADFLAEGGKDFLSCLGVLSLPLLLPALFFLVQAVLAWFAGHAFAAFFVFRVIRNLMHPEGESAQHASLNQAGTAGVSLPSGS